MWSSHSLLECHGSSPGLVPPALHKALWPWPALASLFHRTPCLFPSWVPSPIPPTPAVAAGPECPSLCPTQHSRSSFSWPCIFGCHCPQPRAFLAVLHLRAPQQEPRLYRAQTVARAGQGAQKNLLCCGDVSPCHTMGWRGCATSEASWICVQHKSSVYNTNHLKKYSGPSCQLSGETHKEGRTEAGPR